jgi:carboxyl-terminal processing protease
VIAPIAGGPAERAGVRALDLLAAVDGRALEGMELQAVSSLIRGARGTSVTLGLVRDGAPLDLAVVRETIRIESVRSRLLASEPRLGYLRISTFAEPTAQQVRDQLNTLMGQGVGGVVLDLRGNPGGYLRSAVDVTSVFFKDGVVLYSEAADGARRTYRTSGSPMAPALPMAVLVDGGSASAAEIVAGALHDNQRAVVFGQKTFGKGTVQELHTLSDDSRLRITVAQWLTPNGHTLQGVGLVPDVEVAAVPGAAEDAVLDVAARYLSGEVARGG